MKKEYQEIFEDFPIIMAIRDEEALEESLQADCKIVFILYGNVCNIKDIVQRIVDAGKLAFVHMDMISGLSTKEVAVDFINGHTKAHGIISTRSSVIKRGKELGLFTIQRFFLLDSLALANLKKQSEVSHPDFIEIMPGIIPRVLKKVSEEVCPNVIAGGLISSKEDILNALNAGVTAISTTDHSLWYM
ncbi:MAG: glycerol-3-phosphate responsive antiterminator [Lachnospiraceae bacterium]